MKKRMVSVIFVAALTAIMSMGCGSGKEDNAVIETGAAEADTAKEETGEDGYSIGINCFGSSSYALVTLANNSVKVFDVYGDKTSVSDDNFQIDKLVQDVENLIASGIDGLVVWLPADNLYENIVDLCEKNEIPFVLNDKIPSDETIAAMIKENPYFAGAISPANAVYGAQIAEYALEQGYKTCIVTSSSIGDASDSPRLEAFKETFEAGGGEIVEELHSDNGDIAHGQIEDALIANPDIDFIYGVGSDYGIAACGVLENQGRTDVAVMTSGLDSEAINLLESEQLEVLSGDNWVSGMISAVLLRNFIDGNALKDADGNVPYVTDIQPFALNTDQIALFRKCFIDNFCYSEDELNQMLVKNNAEFNYDSFMEIVNSYSFEERAKALGEAGVVTEDELTAAGIK